MITQYYAIMEDFQVTLLFKSTTNFSFSSNARLIIGLCELWHRCMWSSRPFWHTVGGMFIKFGTEIWRQRGKVLSYSMYWERLVSNIHLYLATYEDLTWAKHVWKYWLCLGRLTIGPDGSARFPCMFSDTVVTTVLGSGLCSYEQLCKDVMTSFKWYLLYLPWYFLLVDICYYTSWKND